MGQNREKHRKNSHLIIHFSTCEGVSEVSERASAAEGASEASSSEQANEWAVQGNERTDEQVAQYCSPDSWLFWPTVPPKKGREFSSGFELGELLRRSRSADAAPALSPFHECHFSSYLNSHPHFFFSLFFSVWSVRPLGDRWNCWNHGLKGS